MTALNVAFSFMVMLYCLFVPFYISIFHNSLLDLGSTCGIAADRCVLVDFIFVCSSQKEEEKDELEPGKAVYYTWAESTGSRELCWKCGTYSGKLNSEKVLGSPRHASD